jgi:hypothetical protein
MTTKITSSNISSTTLATIGSGPKITTIYITDSGYTNLDDTAVDTAGGYIKIIGTGFATGCSVVIGGVSATSVTFISSTEVRAQVPAQAAGSYTVYLVNSDSSVAIRVIGLNYSGLPVWSTSNSLSANASGVSIQFAASSDSTVTYAIQAGSSLPSGLSLTSGGLLSGSVSLSSDTTYNFTIEATDTENQNTPRAFSVTLAVSEPYFRYNALLLHGEGTNLATNNTLVDTSSNGYAITSTGTLYQGSFGPFSPTGWSNYFSGSSQYITRPNINFSTNAFTVEGWFMPMSLASGVNFWGSDNGSGGTPKFILYITGTTLQVECGSLGASLISVTAATYLTVGAWHHIAVVRTSTSSGGLALYINGTSVGTGTLGTLASVTAIFNIGYIGEAFGSTFSGYISNFRITNGTAVYTGNFTVPTSPLATTQSSGTNIAAIASAASTTYLTCQSSRFVDNSTSAATLTLTGNPRAVAFSPFAPTAPYSSSSAGGSVYFSGSTNYAQATNNITTNLIGTGNYTLEFWVYPTVTSSRQDWIDLYPSSGSNRLLVYWDGTNIVYYPGLSAITYTTTLAAIAYQWQHIAVSRLSGSTKMFLNGTQIGSTYTDSINFSISYKPTIFKDPAGSTYATGYISGVRLVVGTGYSSITVPTSVPTTVTGTQFLLTGTNTGIFDSAGQYNIVTGSTAKVSTAQYKNGSSSILLNGTSDYLQMITNQSQTLVLANSDFTIEGWFYFNSLTTSRKLFAFDCVITSGFSGIYVETNGSNGLNLNMSSDGGTWTVNTATSGVTLATGQWYHIAVVRSGSGSSNIKLYVDGTSRATGTFSGTMYTSTTTSYTIGCVYVSSAPAGFFSGYIDEFRVSRYARYTGTFTAPTSSFSDK